MIFMHWKPRNLFSTIKAHAVLASLLLSCVPLKAASCYTLTAHLSSDNTVTTGSPFTYVYSGQFSTVYTNHGSAPNIIFQDTNPAGVLGSPVSTGVEGNSQSGLGDVTATQLGSNAYMAYLAYNSNQLKVAVSPNNSVWSTSYNFSISNANYLFTPTLIAYNGQLVAAYVVGSSVYLATSSNGQVFTPLSSSSISSYTTVSRPAMAVLGNTLYVGFTSGSSRTLVIGPAIVGGTYAPNLAAQSSTWGNNNTKGVYAGVALLGDVNSNTVWVFGQQTAGTNYLQETNGTGTSFPGSVTCGIQLRWTPSVAQFASGGYVMFTFASDTNQDLWYANN
jgi:hypothetical protein